MKPVISLGCALAAAGCVSAPPAARSDSFLGGEAGDLRVLLDDRCPGAYPEPIQPDNEPTKGIEDYASLPGLALSMLTNIGAIAFESFGEYLKRAGQEDVTRSVGANGGLFYTSPASGDVTINPHIRCMYIVRNGFGPDPQPFADSAAPELKDAWTRLNLTRTPDLFAIAHIETSGDIGGGALISANGGGDEDNSAPAFWNPAVSPPYFRVKLDRLYINRFQSFGAAPSRDLALIMNYGLAATRTVVKVDGSDAGVPELATRFAVGGIRLSGARTGDYKGAALTALQSAWMPVPGVKSYDPRATVDIVAYVVEFAPGNPMLEDIGEYLAGPDVRQRVESVISAATGAPN